jgi:hypothetical protein
VKSISESITAIGILAPLHAVNVQHLELLQDVLRGVALRLGLALRRQRRCGGLLL